MSEFMEDQEELESPCTGVCSMDATTGYCQGCYRTTQEIQGWWNMSIEEQKKVLAEIVQRGYTQPA